MARQKSIPIASIGKASGRACGPCTACCDGWVAGTVRGHAMAPGTACHFRAGPDGAGNGGGCTIYHERPRHPCKEFICAWMADGTFPENFRPDLIGLIITRFTWRGKTGYKLVPAGRPVDPAIVAWMRELSHRTGQPFIYEHLGQTMGYGPQAFLGDMQKKLDFA